MCDITRPRKVVRLSRIWTGIALIYMTEGTMLYNNTAGAAFTRETPVIIASAMEPTWVTIPFPQMPAINLTHLDVLFQEHQRNLSHRWSAYKGKICNDDLLNEAFVNVTYLGFRSIQRQLLQIEADLNEMKQRAQTFLNETETSLNRQKRWIKPLLIGGTAIGVAAVILIPELKKGFCSMMSFFGLCDEGLDQIAKHLQWLDGVVRTVTTETGEKIHLLGHSLNNTDGRLSVIAKDSNANFRLLRGALQHLLGATDDYRHYERYSACRTYKNNLLYVNSLRFGAVLANHSRLMTSIGEELIAFKTGLHNFGYILDDALGSLTRGFIPSSLIPPEVLRKVIGATHVEGMQEAIPRSELSSYYGFELVESVAITNVSVNVRINIPMHHMSGLYDVYRAIAIPQPIGTETTATLYRFEKSHLLVSERKNNFAEVTEQLLSSHCSGTNRLRLCLKPFAMSRSSESSCLASLFFNLPNTALRLCPQEVRPLPEKPLAEYLDDSTYLVTSRSNDFQLVEHSGGRLKGTVQLQGCMSCLVRPHCNGRTETPSGSLVLYPDARTCEYDQGLVVHIKQHPILETLFRTLDVVQDEMVGVEVPKEFVGKAHAEMLETLKLNLIQLPEGTLNRDELAKIAEPFARNVLKEHAPFHWQAYHSNVSRILILLILLAVIATLAVTFMKRRRSTVNQVPLRTHRQKCRFPSMGLSSIDDRLASTSASAPSPFVIDAKEPNMNPCESTEKLRDTGDDRNAMRKTVKFAVDGWRRLTNFKETIPPPAYQERRRQGSFTGSLVRD